MERSKENDFDVKAFLSRWLFAFLFACACACFDDAFSDYLGSMICSFLCRLVLYECSVVVEGVDQRKNRSTVSRERMVDEHLPFSNPVSPWLLAASRPSTDTVCHEWAESSSIVECIHLIRIGLGLGAGRRSSFCRLSFTTT
jgi:hypothetical protein